MIIWNGSFQREKFGNIWKKILGKIWSCVENNSGSPGKSIQVKLSASVIYFKYANNDMNIY